MKASELIEAIKEFFFDFIGFLIPGFVFISLSFIILNDSSIIKDVKTEFGSFFEILLLVSSYCIGYVIYGAALLRDEILNKWRSKYPTPDTLGDSIKKSYEYSASIWILKKLWGIERFSEDERLIENSRMQTVRSHIMSYIPEADAKIYGFMFRSELCNLLNMALIIIALLGISNFALYGLNSLLVSSDNILIVMNEPKPIFKNDIAFLIAYLVLIPITAKMLYKTRIRFLSITYRIPFSIFVSKYYKFPK